jgi:alpha-tubulin suppressor-like RCC1 family protein
LTTGTARCWGNSSVGQTGNALSPEYTVLGLDPGTVDSIATGDYFACALVKGQVSCWGWNMDGQLGGGANGESYFAVPIPSWER